MKHQLYLGVSQLALVVKNPSANTGDIRDTGSIPGSERSPGKGNGNWFQYSCLENPMDSGAWWATVHRIAKGRIWPKRLSSTHTIMLRYEKRRQWHPTPVLLPGKSHGWRSLVGCSPWGRYESLRATSLSLFTFMHWRRKWQPTPMSLPGESQGQGSLVGCRLWGHTESDTTEVT